MATLEIGGGGWQFTPVGVGADNSGGFIPVTGSTKSPAAPPPVDLPLGLVDFVATGGVPGSALTVTITYPTPLPAGAVYWKYGKTPWNASPHWYRYSRAVISGNTVTLPLTDGSSGDDDLSVNGILRDPGGPGLPLKTNILVPLLPIILN